MGCLYFTKVPTIFWAMACEAGTSVGETFDANSHTRDSRLPTLSPSSNGCNSCNEPSRFVQKSVFSTGSPALRYFTASAINFYFLSRRMHKRVTVVGFCIRLHQPGIVSAAYKRIVLDTCIIHLYSICVYIPPKVSPRHPRI